MLLRRRREQVGPGAPPRARPRARDGELGVDRGRAERGRAGRPLLGEGEERVITLEITV